MPENTIEAMLEAVRLGVKTLELDVVISKDQQVVVSHDTYMSSGFMLKPNGDKISNTEEKDVLLYQMDYQTIIGYDGGTKFVEAFPKQKKFRTYKPLLAQLIDSVELYVKQHHLKPVYYNIEIKSRKDGDHIAHPAPMEFSEALMKVIQSKNIASRTIIQSFDVRPLQYLHKTYPKQMLSYLVANTKSFSDNLADLEFTPNIISPYYKIVNQDFVNEAHQKQINVVPWTVNTPEEIESMTKLGVDGIISDYPDLLINRFGTYQ